MKKTLMALSFFALLAIALVPDRVFAYSPHYLPGGKNYLSGDNFELDSGYYTAIENFLVKPNTTYCLSLGRDYTDTQPFVVQIDLFVNATFSKRTTLDEYDILPVMGQNWSYYVFTTGATENYIDLSFSDPTILFETHGVDLFQLEEGAAFTGWAAYVEGTLADINGPYFEGEGVVISDYDDPITAAEIRAGLVATDAIDGDVSASIVQLTDGYTGNEDTLGEYVITYSVADVAGNVTGFQITVKVVDVADPVFGGDSTVVVPFPAVLTIASIQTHVNASDNYDGDLTAAITLKSDGYTASAAVLGSYPVVFTVADASGNVADCTVMIQVVDQAAPVFSGPTEWTIGYDSDLLVADVLAELAVLDDYDTDLTSEITVESDGYSAHLQEIGTYTIVFRVEDGSGNAALYPVLVHVVDAIGPVVYIDAAIVRVYDMTVLSLSDFTALLVRAGELPRGEGYEVRILYDSYTAHATTPGVYHMRLEIVDPYGATHLKSLQIVVSEAGTIHVPGPVPDGGRPASQAQLAAWITAGVGLLGAIVSNLVWLLKLKKR